MRLRPSLQDTSQQIITEMIPKTDFANCANTDCSTLLKVDDIETFALNFGPGVGDNDEVGWVVAVDLMCPDCGGNTYLHMRYHP